MSAFCFFSKIPSSNNVNCECTKCIQVCVTIVQLESKSGDLLGDNHQRPDQQIEEEMLLHNKMCHVMCSGGGEENHLVRKDRSS